MSAALADLQDSWVGSSKLFKQSITEYRIHLKNFRDKEVPENPPYPVFGVKFTKDQLKCINFFRKFTRGLLSEEELGVNCIRIQSEGGGGKSLVLSQIRFDLHCDNICMPPYVVHYHTSITIRLYVTLLVLVVSR